MVRNQSNLDRILRAVVGGAILIAWIAGALSGGWAVVLGLIGLVLVATAIVGFCPLYRALGISTFPAPKKR